MQHNLCKKTRYKKIIFLIALITYEQNELCYYYMAVFLFQTPCVASRIVRIDPLFPGRML